MKEADKIDSARLASTTGALADHVAQAADPSHSLIGRVGKAGSAIGVAARLLPVGLRLVRRFPLGSTLLLIGVAYAAYAWKSNDAPDGP